MRPPVVAHMQLLRATDADGRPAGRLELRYAERLPARLKFFYEGEVRVLRDDGVAPDPVAGDGNYSALVPLPEDGTTELVGDVARAPVELAATTPLDPEKGLLVRDLSVVNDSSRTKDPCKSTSTDDAKKKWTFGYLLTQMAKGVSPSVFATAWLEEWSEKNKNISDDLVEPVQGGNNREVAAEALRQWRCVSGATKCCRAFELDEQSDFVTNPGDPNDPFQQCAAQAESKPLLMNKAPFRLLAIVNRLDLRGNLFFDEALAGELRFVFSVLDLQQKDTATGACVGMEQIHQPRARCRRALQRPHRRPQHRDPRVHGRPRRPRPAVKAWGPQRPRYNNLNGSSPSDSDYRSRLQTITDTVVVAGSGVPSGRIAAPCFVSAPTRRRTSRPVQLREFKIDRRDPRARAADHQATPQQASSPITRARPRGDFCWPTYIRDNLDAVLAETHVVPALEPLTGLAVPGRRDHPR